MLVPENVVNRVKQRAHEIKIVAYVVVPDYVDDLARARVVLRPGKFTYDDLLLALRALRRDETYVVHLHVFCSLLRRPGFDQEVGRDKTLHRRILG